MTWELSKLWTFAFSRAPSVNSIKASAKKVQKSYDTLMTLNSDPNFEEKLTFCLKNGMKNLVNFNATIGKSENSQINGLLFVKRM